MALLTTKNALKDDNYDTPLSAWRMIAPYIPKDKTIWEAFYSNGTSGDHLRALGFEVIHQNADFFEHNLGDIVVSNPPFSKKWAILKRLKDLNKPFVLLLPASVLGTKQLQTLFPDIQVAIPRGRISFIKNGEQTKNVWFASFFYAWKMNLPKDLLFLPE